MNIEKELVRLRDLQKQNWKDLRSCSNYTLTTLEFSFGKRDVYVIDRNKQESYEDLQSSRGIVNADTLDDVISNNQSYTLTPADLARIDELELFNRNCPFSKTEFFELGFRFPRLLTHYAKEFDVVKGCDIVDFNVEVGKKLNFDVVKCDLSLDVPDVSNASLVVAYHVLEHVSHPHITLQRLFEKMKLGSYFHVEIPIEPGTPRIRYAHLFPFERGDIFEMCTQAGFTIVHSSIIPFEGGPDIERCLVRKL